MLLQKLERASLLHMIVDRLVLRILRQHVFVSDLVRLGRRAHAGRKGKAKKCRQRHHAGCSERNTMVRLIKHVRLRSVSGHYVSVKPTYILGV